MCIDRPFARRPCAQILDAVLCRGWRASRPTSDMIVDASARCSGDGFVPRGGPRQAHAREAAGGPISTFSVFWIGASTFSGTMVNGMVWLALTSPLVVGRVSNDLFQARHRCGPSGQQAYSHRRRTSWASRCLTWRGARARAMRPVVHPETRAS